MKQRVYVCLCLWLSLTVCTACKANPRKVAPVPPQWEVKPAEWAARYPNEYRDWASSVHGAAYLVGNADVPSCTGCHGDPQSGELQTVGYRLSIPSRCARCHDDQALMRKYKIATDAYDTYLPGFHGSTIEYYRANDPEVWRYEAVCSDCHQAHAIYRPDDPRSSVAAGNLLKTCQKCHQGAEASFALAANGHFRTTPAASRLVYYAELFYKVLIPLTIGGMLLYVILDMLRRARQQVGV